MRELGVSARQLHKEVGRAAAVRGVDVLLGVGYWGRLIVTGARQARAKLRTHVAADTRQALAWLKDFVRSGDTVLIKASRAKEFDRIVAGLTTGQARKGR
jgi:UDP-N-acetylmuramoyl-tripeptide--D-alanyl-D-alanine ligase